MSKILFLAGSARRDSMNKKLAQQAYELAVEKGADATLLDLSDYPMPLYDGDLEAADGLPEAARRLKKVFAAHQALFIASPEYNGFLPPLLKNAIDWISRPESADEPRLIAFQGKIATLTATAPGHFGGLRGLQTLRTLLSNINVDVMGQQLVIPYYTQAFNEEGRLINEAALVGLDDLIDQLLHRVARLR